MSFRAPRNGKEIMDFQLRGKLPRDIEAPLTPLLALIKRIPVTYWRQFGAVRLSPELGFRNSSQFHSLCQLATWLGHNRKISRTQVLPYMSYRLRSVQIVTLEKLLEHCTGSPTEDQLVVIQRRLPQYLR